MCIIIDSTIFGEFNKNSTEIKPVKDWMKKSGKIVYGNAGRLKIELHRSTKMLKLFADYRKQGKLKLIGSEVIDDKSRALNQHTLRSNDRHIIALAQASMVRVLVTSGDHRLINDFKRLIQGGKVYMKKSHKHLLKQDLCP